MEIWERDFEWLRVRHIVKKALNRDQLPDFQAVLFLVGVQELGRFPKERFTKEEKRDLMHVAVCTLLEKDGYFEFIGRDQDGWPHFKEIKPLEISGDKEQEAFLIKKIIQYFHSYNEVTTFEE
jgi:hypothetical protein